MSPKDAGYPWMKYKILIEKKAAKFIEKQPKEQRLRLLAAVYQLPDRGNIKPMQGKENVFRLRVGSYRILYSVEHDVLTVRVIAAGNRGDIYK